MNAAHDLVAIALAFLLIVTWDQLGPKVIAVLTTIATAL